MASLDFIQKRIAGKEKEIDKLTKKLARIREAEAGNWENNNPYMYSEFDLRYCQKDLELAQAALAKYRDELQTEQEKAASRNVAVILEFLEGWKNRNREFYTGQFSRYLEALEERKQKDAERTDWWNHGGWDDPNWQAVDKAHNDYMEAFHAKWDFIAAYTHQEQNPDTGLFETVFDLDRLNKDLNKEANRKYDFIIKRTNAIVGTITDASGLTIGEKGDLNGFVVGTRGTAKVQTIGAGGYNIQCFHFRTLIHPVK